MVYKSLWKWIHDHPPQQRIWPIPRLTMALIWGYRIFFYHWILYRELSSMSVENVLGSLILDEENKNWYMVSGHGSRHFCTNGLSKVISFHFQPSNVEGWSFWLIILTHTHLGVEQNCRAFTKKTKTKPFAMSRDESEMILKVDQRVPVWQQTSQGHFLIISKNNKYHHHVPFSTNHLPTIYQHQCDLSVSLSLSPSLSLCLSVCVSFSLSNNSHLSIKSWSIWWLLPKNAINDG